MTGGKKLELVYKYFDIEKTKIFHKIYLDSGGFRQGKYESFHENGNISISSQFKDNRLVGKYACFDTEGKMRHIDTMVVDNRFDLHGTEIRFNYENK